MQYATKPSPEFVEIAVDCGTYIQGRCKAKNIGEP